MPEKAVFLWSGGKDSALALYDLQQRGAYEIAALVTTITEEHDRVSVHAVRTQLLEMQAESVGLPLDKVYIPYASPNEVYQARVLEALRRHKAEGVTSVVLGDIFLEDVRQWRKEHLLSKLGLGGVFPLWNRPTQELARTFIDLGFKSVLCVVDSQALDGSFAGRIYDEQLLADLPPGVDPCGENGEFHTFVYDGPLFSHPIPWGKGDVTLQAGRFWHCDLLPGTKS